MYLRLLKEKESVGIYLYLLARLDQNLTTTDNKNDEKIL